MDKLKDCDAVTIAVRQRPLTSEEEENNEEKIAMEILPDNLLIIRDNHFVFDKIIKEDQSQEDVYVNSVKQLVSKVLDGYHCAVLAYGQTGTGKTYTMGLQSEETDETKIGIIPRALNDILKMSNDGESQMTISVSFIEIYNEKVYDLLSENPALQFYSKGQKYTGATKKVILNNDANDIIKQGNKNRHVRPTKMNANSSRSHAIFSVHIEAVRETVKTESSLHLVDLAGSEGVRRTSHKGDALAEGVNINQGLLSIGRVIGALSQNAKTYVTYRDSVLTSVLQDSLNSRSYLTLLACISPLQKDATETMSTLRFAKQTKTLKNTPKINALLAEHKKIKTPANVFKTPFVIQRPSTLKHPDWVTSTAFTSGGAKRALLPKSKSFTPINHKLDGNRIITPFNKFNPIANRQKLFSNDTINLTIPKPIENHDDSIGCSVLEVNEQTVVSPSISSHAPQNAIQTIQQSSSAALPTISYSPIVRQCMKQIEGTLDRRLQTILDNFSNSLYQTMMDPEKTNRNVTQLPTVSVMNRMKSQNDFQPNFSITTANNQKPGPQASCSFKRPLTPPPLKRQILEPVEQIEVMRSDSSENEGDDEPLSFDLENRAEETIKSLGRRSTSVGISSFYNVDENTIMNSTMKENLPVTTVLRRSSRWSMVRPNSNETIQSNNTMSCDDSNNTVSRSSSVRRSARLSLMMERKISDEVKITESIHKYKPRALVDITNDSTVQNEKNVTVIDAPKIKKPHKKLTVEGNIEKISKATSKDEALNVHKKYVLRILNTGDLKEVQLLASIGLKTAHQIITYRCIKGKFKDIESLAKLPFWRGKGYNRFLESNNLI